VSLDAAANGLPLPEVMTMMRLNRSLLLLSALLLAATPSVAQPTPGAYNWRLFGTRSIVACDPATRACGIAVISFPAGITALVPYGKPGAVVASMMIPSVDDAQAILARMDGGQTPQQAVDAIVAADPMQDLRQFGVVKLLDNGTVLIAQHTGSSGNAETCSVRGATYAVQANNQTSAAVCQAMAQAFQQATGSLAYRLYKSLVAGAGVGTDRNGEYSGTVRVWSSSADLSFVTHIIADASVSGSRKALADLKTELDRYVGQLGGADPADRVEFDTSSARQVQRLLRLLGYYSGPVDSTWSAEEEQALADFQWNNTFFFKPTVVENGKRYIDGPTLAFMLDSDPATFLRASP
jgi:uncharacterized Ntn-hydrolase superfamily protein